MTCMLNVSLVQVGLHYFQNKDTLCSLSETCDSIKHLAQNETLPARVIEVISNLSDCLQNSVITCVENTALYSSLGFFSNSLQSAQVEFTQEFCGLSHSNI